MHRRSLHGAIAALVAAALPAAAQDAAVGAAPDSGTSWTVSSGIDYSSGKYGGTQATDILVGLFDLTLVTGDFQFGASVPYLSISGPPGVLLGAGGKPVIVNRKAIVTSGAREGFGDLNLSATYSLNPEDMGGFQVDLVGRTKIAIADSAKGLSSGESDFGFSVDVSRQIDIWSPFVTFGYRVPGSPAAYSLNSAPSFSIGTSAQISDSLVGTVSYDFDGGISKSLADAQQMFGSVSWLVDERWTITAYAEMGLSSGAPQQGTGLLIGWKLP